MAGKIFREIERTNPLRLKIEVFLMMDDIKNWDNGEYKGDKEKILQQTDYIIKMVKKHIQHNIPIE
jgi:hypothetical protein